MTVLRIPGAKPDRAETAAIVSCIESNDMRRHLKDAAAHLRLAQEYVGEAITYPSPGPALLADIETAERNALAALKACIADQAGSAMTRTCGTCEHRDKTGEAPSDRAPVICNLLNGDRSPIQLWAVGSPWISMSANFGCNRWEKIKLGPCAKCGSASPDAWAFCSRQDCPL